MQVEFDQICVAAQACWPVFDPNLNVRAKSLGRYSFLCRLNQAGPIPSAHNIVITISIM